jgi:hypothetical protein
MYNIIITKTITDDDLINILSGANDSCSYWVGEYKYDENDYKESRNKLNEPCFEDVLLQMLKDNKKLGYYDSEDDVTHYLTLDKLLNGIKLNVEQRPHDCDLEDSDGTTCDCILQFALMGEVVYG